ncbi:CDK5RAP1-like protein isoform X1 [Neodiprion lecontei]|uniref:CDK5RAP1-like protein n=2 Tax=Neodiprion lecontei TaxID=441921 RepID=A0A6J0CDH8_NEOLC|nr:CDK5RAP1-like protein isoform X1 [Neodiprion lecontei]XP_046410353.1 CDK5RAP1-like protein isoform X1 [Neodiprion fabricii]
MSGLKCAIYRYGLTINRHAYCQLGTDYRRVFGCVNNHNLSKYNLQIYRTKHENASITPKLIDDREINSITQNGKPFRTFPNLSEGPDLKDFIKSDVTVDSTEAEPVPYLKATCGNDRKVYFSVYGCQMNVSDTEIIWSILKKTGYQKTDTMTEADVILLVTCAIRDAAEQKIWHKLVHLKHYKKWRSLRSDKPPLKVGLLGCMAERLKHKLLETDKIVDVVAGPDSYKDLPRLLSLTEDNQTAINVILSYDETYADVTPVRINQDSVTAFVSIMRGCDNMCTYCIVPFTRGRERSRPIASILDEVSHLSDQGVKEVTLLGQNVNSYRDLSESKFATADKSDPKLAAGFKTVYKPKIGGLRFSDLLDKVSQINPEMRIRFTSPHPKDFPDEVLQLIAERPNICRNIHLPAQSGNSTVLERMRRGYTREAYISLVEHIREIIPDISLSSDFICGFCGETEEEFADTISLMQMVKYNMAYLFAYSMREKTTAHRRHEDNVDPKVKQDRLRRMITIYRTEVQKLNEAMIGRQYLVLVEKKSRKSEFNMQGRTSGNIKVIFPRGSIQDNRCTTKSRNIEAGDYVVVQIINANSQVLKGIPLYHSSITQYALSTGNHYERMAYNL